MNSMRASHLSTSSRFVHIMHIIKQYALVGHFVRYTLLVFCLVCLKDGLNSLYRPSEYSELIVT